MLFIISRHETSGEQTNTPLREHAARHTVSGSDGPAKTPFLGGPDFPCPTLQATRLLHRGILSKHHSDPRELWRPPLDPGGHWGRRGQQTFPVMMQRLSGGRQRTGATLTLCEPGLKHVTPPAAQPCSSWSSFAQGRNLWACDSAGFSLELWGGKGRGGTKR